MLCRDPYASVSSMLADLLAGKGASNRCGSGRCPAAFHPALVAAVASVVVVAALSLISPVLGVAASDRVRFLPKFTQGETLRYQVESRTVTTGSTTTPIDNPEGESKVSETINLLVRLDVFGVERDTRGTPGKVRLNAIFEQSRSSPIATP